MISGEADDPFFTGLKMLGIHRADSARDYSWRSWGNDTRDRRGGGG